MYDNFPSAAYDRWKTTPDYEAPATCHCSPCDYCGFDRCNHGELNDLCECHICECGALMKSAIEVEQGLCNECWNR